VYEFKTPAPVVKPRRPNGLVLHRGPSQLDGSPIVVVAVGFRAKSKNAKTGNMLAVYILGDDGHNPIEAIKAGKAKSICGDCPHIGRSCYVNVAQAPLAVYKALHLGTYPTFHPPKHLHYFRGRHVRLGSYGDPAAVPFRVWSLITGVVDGWTGYTHQWRTCDRRYAQVCMASCETASDARLAWEMGYRTFRVRLASQPVEAGEFVCPASAEAGKRLTCSDCQACSGAKEGGKNVSPTIIFHGPDNAVGRWMLKGYEGVMARRVSLPMAN
jgi:hypothetical protein